MIDVGSDSDLEITELAMVSQAISDSSTFVESKHGNTTEERLVFNVSGNWT